MYVKISGSGLWMCSCFCHGVRGFMSLVGFGVLVLVSRFDFTLQRAVVSSFLQG